MNHSITQFLGRKLSNDEFDLKLARVTCFGAGALVLVFSMWEVLRLDLTEVQVFFGVLLSLVVPLLCMIMGLLLPIAAIVRNRSLTTS